jgi:predicted RNA-binding protein with PUA-like domain
VNNPAQSRPRFADHGETDIPNLVKYWLLKSEPSACSWDDLVRDKQTFWGGVSSHQARNNMAAIKAEKTLGEIAIVKQSRLSVLPLRAPEFKKVLRIGGLC